MWFASARNVLISGSVNEARRPVASSSWVGSGGWGGGAGGFLGLTNAKLMLGLRPDGVVDEPAYLAAHGRWGPTGADLPEHAHDDVDREVRDDARHRDAHRGADPDLALVHDPLDVLYSSRVVFTITPSPKQTICATRVPG